MKLYNDNLDFTGNKYNNPYALIQQAGKKTNKRSKSRKTNKRRKSNKTRRSKSKRSKK
jgi:hypothetical protein